MELRKTDVVAVAFASVPTGAARDGGDEHQAVPVTDTVGMKRRRRRAPVMLPSGFAGFRFPAEIIMLAVRWYLRYGLSYRDVEELLAIGE